MSILCKKLPTGKNIIDILKKLTHMFEDEKYTQYIFDSVNNHLYLPFYFALKNGFTAPIVESLFVSIRLQTINITLFDRQIAAFNFCKSSLSTNRTASLKCYPGFGKTKLSLYIMKEMGLKTIIVTHNVITAKQWVNALTESWPESSICDMVAKTSQDADVIICNRQQVVNIEEKYRTTGLLILDESHLLSTKAVKKDIMLILPCYVLSCSATPDRIDELDEIGKNIIGNNYYEEMNEKPYILAKYKINVPFTGDIRKKYKESEKNYSELLETNRKIVEVIKKYADNGQKILVVSSYIKQCLTLNDMLQSIGISSDTFILDNITFNGMAQVLIGTSGKLTTGFDQESVGVEFDRRFDVAVSCQTIANPNRFIQLAGRIFRASVSAEYTHKEHPDTQGRTIALIIPNCPFFEGQYNRLISQTGLEKYIKKDYCI